MEKAVHVKANSKWKKVEFDPAFLSAKGFDGLISFEELTDYDILGSEHPNKLKQKNKQKEQKETKACDDLAANNSRENKKTKESKKRKRKKKKQKTNDVIEDLNKALENESLQSEKSKKKKKRKKKRDSEDQNASPKKKAKLEPSESSEEINIKKENAAESLDEKDFKVTGMENWVPLMVPNKVLRALKEQGFHEPTPIQAQVLPSAIRDHMDIVGAAETGSGKTLAFGIPVLHFILRKKENQALKDLDADEDSGVESGNIEADDSDASDEEGIVMEMTEDAETEDISEDAADSDDDGDSDEDDQEVDENDDEDPGDLEEGENEMEDGEEDSGEEGVGKLGEDGMGCVRVVKDADFSWLEEQEEGGATVQATPKKTHPLALILEPTRELAIQVKNHLMAAAKYTDIKIVTIVGGMSVQKQERVLRRCPDVIIATPGRLWELVQKGETYLSELEKTQHLVVDEADRMIEKGHFEELSKLLEHMNKDAKWRDRRHTYVFSATLTLIHSGPQRTMKKKKKIKLDEKQKLELLVQNIGLKVKPKIVDLTRKVGTVETLTEARINCAKDEKDIYLYYFLKQYPGRTLVFTNSKDCIRRLISIFTLLQCNPFPLHADMHQRQRLKNLDRFRDKSQSLLIASDVAARGLDIPNVQHVIHYQVPHTVENYVHRSGRTARASKEGLSVVLVGPEDLKNYRKIIHTLNKSEDLPLFPIDTEFMTEIERRVKMVRTIETQEYRFNKTKRQNDWFTKAAEDAGIEIDENDRLLNDLGDDVAQNRHRTDIKHMKAELSMILKQPLLPRGAGSKYPTKSGQLVQLTRKEEEKDAILNVKKDKKTQQKMMEKEKNRPLPVKKKKDKWKKKQKPKKNKPKEDD